MSTLLPLANCQQSSRMCWEGFLLLFEKTAVLVYG